LPVNAYLLGLIVHSRTAGGIVGVGLLDGWAVWCGILSLGLLLNRFGIATLTAGLQQQTLV